MQLNKKQNSLNKKIINLIIYILRYFSIIDKNYDEISDKINFGSKKADIFFKKNLKKSKYYFEYGSGNSTILSKKYKKNFYQLKQIKAFIDLLKKRY